MKIDLKALVDGIEFQTDESQSFLNIKSGDILFFTDEELQLAEGKQDISEYASMDARCYKYSKKIFRRQS